MKLSNQPKDILGVSKNIAHLRPRTNLFNAIFRIRSVTSFAIHEYFQNNGLSIFMLNNNSK